MSRQIDFFFTLVGSPPVVVSGPCDALCTGIGMTINLPVHLMSVTQQYFNHE